MSKCKNYKCEFNNPAWGGCHCKVFDDWDDCTIAKIYHEIKLDNYSPKKIIRKGSQTKLFQNER